MTNLSDNDLFDDFEDETGAAGQEEPEKRPRKGKFGLLVVILAVVFLLAVIAMAVIAAIYLPSRSATRQQQAAEINAANTATAQAATEVAFVQQLALTPSATPIPSNTPKPSPTAVVLQPSSTSVVAVTTGTAEPEGAVAKDLLSRTQTVAALLTQAAQGYSSASGTALPATGFADEVGLPGMIGLAAVLVVVILLVRHMRFSGRN